MIDRKAIRGTFKWGQQVWPATAIGAAEFRRTQAKRAKWLAEVAEVWLRWCRKDEPGMVVQTSGTTGTPKRMEHSRAAVLASVEDTLKHWDLGAGTRALLALPTSFVAGQAMIVRSLVGAWELEIIEPSSAPSWNGEKDFVALTPHQARGWIAQGSGTTVKLLLGGGPVSKSLLGMLLDSKRVEDVWESYGLSETLTHVAARKLQTIDDLQSPFQPLPGVTIETNEEGCAVIHAPSRNVTLETRDCIEELPTGGFLWLGRADDIINSGGVLVHPAEVERAFETFMPAWVSDWAAFGKADDTLGEAVVLRLTGTVPEDVDAKMILEEWREMLKAMLGPAKTPRTLEWGELPRTDRGKLQRRLLS